MQVATTMLSGDVKRDTSTASLCSIIFKSILSFFLRQSATVDSLASSSESSIVLAADVHTLLIPPSHTNHTQLHLQSQTQTQLQHEHIPQQHQHLHLQQSQQTQQQQQYCTIHSQSTLSLYFTTQPSSTFSFYSCSSCSSPFMPSSASCASSSIAPLPFIVSPTNTFNNSSAGHFRPLCVNVNADDSRVYRRLLVQLEETERRFDDFWNTHLMRLKQCLDLRRFEQDFRELQVSGFCFKFSFKCPNSLESQVMLSIEFCRSISIHISKSLPKWPKLVKRLTASMLWSKTQNASKKCATLTLNEPKKLSQLVNAAMICLDLFRLLSILIIYHEIVGQQLISVRGACPKEVVQPKCDELSRVCDIVTDRLSRRLEILLKSRDLMERVEKVCIAFCYRIDTLFWPKHVLFILLVLKQ